MNISKILPQKRKYSNEIKTTFNLLKKNKLNWLIALNNDEIISNIINGLSILNTNFVIISNLDIKTTKNIKITNEIKENLYIGFDFIICDETIQWIENYMKKWIVPLIYNKNYMWSILKEWNPMKNEWNSFLYNKKNEWSIFYSLVKYLENTKFSFDNKSLIKNIIEI